MKNPIQFKPDSYGRSMRASYCADYLEGLALTGIVPRWGDYGDFMSDLAIESNLQPAQDTHSVSESGCEFEDFGESGGVRLIKDQIEERSGFLGKKYPFEIRSDGLYMKPGGEKDHRVYLALLALTLLHTSDSATKPSPSPEAELERSVAASIAKIGLTVSVMGTASGSSGKFSARLAQVGKQLQLTVADSAAVRPIQAQDEGVDVIALIELQDRRPGQWTFIGQVTCASCEDWKHKAYEPQPGAWRKYLSLTLKPIVFLAVPHHAESLVIQRFSDDIVVLDRIRLTNARNMPTRGEKKLLSELQKRGLEFSM